MRNRATEVGQQFYKAVLFLALRGVVIGPCAVLYHSISVLDRSRIEMGIWLIYAEFSDKDGASYQAFR